MYKINLNFCENAHYLVYDFLFRFVNFKYHIHVLYYATFKNELQEHIRLFITYFLYKNNAIKS